MSTYAPLLVIESSCILTNPQAGVAPDKDWKRGQQPISDLLRETFDTNVFGAAQTAETFVPLLSKAENPRLIFMSSGIGSLARASSGGNNKQWPAYAASKAALNMVMLWYANEYPEWKVNSCAPGFRVRVSSSVVFRREVRLLTTL
jgi:NAD(P)-dependent dehydrogenase (short-subunit alcohol dehydrogenase family)